MSTRAKKRRVIVPFVLAVTVAGAAATSGCGDDKPKVDAGVHDAAPDSPIV